MKNQSTKSPHLIPLDAGTREIVAALKDLPIGPDSVAALRDAIEHEQAGQARNVVLARLQSALQRIASDPAASPQDPALVPVALAINDTLAILEDQEEKARRKEMPHRLWIGVQCLIAHGKFALKDPGNRGQGRKSGKIMSRRDMISEPSGFEQWVAVHCPGLGRSASYKYMACAKGLGLSEKTEFSTIAAALEQTGWPSLGELADAGRGKAPAPLPSAPTPPEQQVFPFMRDLRLAGEQVVAMKENMDPQAYKTAVAVAYDTLKKLTGQDWEPSKTPGVDLSPLATITL